MITTVKVLDDIDKKILKLAGEGLTVKEMAYKLNKSSRSIEYRVNCMKKYYNCKTTTQLIVKLKDEL